MLAAERAEARENLRLALPIVLAQVGTMSMGLIDTAIVGRVSELQLASVAIGNTLVMAVMLPAFGVFMALEPLVSQALGAGEPARARIARREGMRLAFAMTLPVVLVTWASLALLPLMKVDPAVIPGARAYVFARLPATLPFFLYMAAKTYQQAAQRPRAALEAVILANVVHAITGWVAAFGDPGLVRLGLPPIGMPALGGVGAGIATSASSVLMALWIVGARGAIPRGAPDAGEAPPPGIDLVTIKKLLQVGIPIGMQLAAEVGVFSMVALLMGRIGGRAAAAHQIAIGLASMAFMGALGIAQATSVRVGLAIGEGAREHAPRRAGMVGIGLGIMVMGGWALVFAIAPRALARVFTADPNVIEAASTLIRIAALFQLADGAQVVAAGALRGAADTRWPLVLNVLMHWCVGLPLGWTLAFRLGRGAEGLWYGLTAGLVMIALALITRFRVVTRGAVARIA